MLYDAVDVQETFESVNYDAICNALEAMDMLNRKQHVCINWIK